MMASVAVTRHYDVRVSAKETETSPRPPLRLWWRATDPPAVAAVLERLGLRLSDGSVTLGAIVLSVVGADGDDHDRLEVGDPIDDSRSGTASDGPRLAALGWATVDAERLAAALDKPLIDEAHDDPALGATGYGIASASLPLVLLEPTTEGRIAAALARLGEGPVALYLAGVTLGSDDDATRVTSTGTGRQGRLLRSPRPSGPFIVALEP